MGRLQGKVAWISGAGSGIGRASAVLFAREGASVTVAEISPESGEETVRLIRAAGGEAQFRATDVTQPETVVASLAAAVAAHGRLDILFNNAGGSSARDGPVTLAPVEEFWRAIRLDLFGTWICCRYGIPHLAAAGGGSVINMVSVAAVMGLAGRDAYTAAKGGVAALTRSMAVEYAPQRVRVNAIAPTRTRTERVEQLHASGRTSRALDERDLLGWAEPADVAYAALYLASDESRVTTGHILRVDSGITIS